MKNKETTERKSNCQSSEAVGSTDYTETEKNIMRYTAKYLDEFKARKDITYNELRDRLIEIIAMSTGEYIRLSR